MNDDGENVVYFEPRKGGASDASYIANPLNLRRELHRNALTKGLVGFDEFGHQVILRRPIPRPNIKVDKDVRAAPMDRRRRRGTVRTP